MTLAPSVASAHELVRSLVLLGVRDVVLAPGSRSAPLAYALAIAARGPLRLHVRVDERDAGFLALGLARAGQARAERAVGPACPLAPPVAVVTTSGTAVANLHPAVLEAHHAGVPLLVLTADRPHELRGTGANQTADQVGIFGTAVRLGVDVPAPTGSAGELQDLRTVVTRAVAAATGARTLQPGPVHLNLAYREPLAPDAAGLAELAELSGGLTGAPGPAGRRGPLPRGLVEVAPAVRGALGDPVGAADEPATLVVAGDGAGAVARAVAEARGWPLLAEASSGSAGGPNLVAAHRLVLGSSELVDSVRQVVVVGRPTLSRPVQQLLGRPEVRVVVVAPGSGPWPDAARSAAVVLPDVPASWLETPEAGGSPRTGATVEPGAGTWLGTWQRASARAAGVVDRWVGDAGAGPLDALQVAAAVAAASGPRDVLVVGSSNPVRDLDLVARWAEPPVVVANRGLAGIDGTVSTVVGVALGVQDARSAPAAGGPGPVVRALLGDLTFLHDVGGLLTGPHEPSADVQVVVVNDDGGSIFATLEHGRTGDTDLFERVFATPHGANLGLLCAGYGVQHDLVHDAGRLRAALAHPPHGVSVLEVQVERASRHHSGQDLAAAVVEAL